MSLQALVAVSTPDWTLVELLTRINSALASCQSVTGLYSVQQLVGRSYPQLRSIPLLSEDVTYIDESALRVASDEINGSSEGLDARWKVRRFRRSEEFTGIESCSRHLTLLFHPISHRSWIFSSLKVSIFMDAGSNQAYIPTRLDDELAAEAAKLNLEALVQEMISIAQIPVNRLIGIPVQSIDPEVPLSTRSAWLYFDGRHYDYAGIFEVNSRVERVNTTAGPLYYSTEGPIGNVSSLSIGGEL